MTTDLSAPVRCSHHTETLKFVAQKTDWLYISDSYTRWCVNMTGDPAMNGNIGNESNGSGGERNDGKNKEKDTLHGGAAPPL